MINCYSDSYSLTSHVMSWLHSAACATSL